ncbi:hypothetical protein D9M71_533010 [compost metagenome]
MLVSGLAPMIQHSALGKRSRMAVIDGRMSRPPWGLYLAAEAALNTLIRSCMGTASGTLAPPVSMGIARKLFWQVSCFFLSRWCP